MNKRLFWLLCLLGIESILQADVKVTNVSVKPRWPWNGLVDITYSVVCKEMDEDNNLKDVYLDFTAIDGDRNQTIPMKSLTGDGAKDPVKDGGPYMVTWDASKDAPTLNSTDLKVRIHAIAGIAPYLVVYLDKLDKVGEKKYEYKSKGPNLDDDTCRTTELWLRQIPAGTFTMGSPSDEVGRYSNYDMVQHQVTITQMFYIGVFECTQKQWELVMGSNPSSYKGDCRPVENVTYSMIRGASVMGTGWPTYGHAVDASSFMGGIQEKTGLVFDLPTDAQWEYACRAGTMTALNSGKELTNPLGRDVAMDEVGRYSENQKDGKGGYTTGHTKVGSYLPNDWGLYDMHGNVWEWCLDWWGANMSSMNAEEDPKGPTSGRNRVIRSGGWNNASKAASGCRSAFRESHHPSDSYYDFGFRVLCLPFY